ncbi:unnamed protein product [Prorocentrum cordatum]|uniref:Uncharacterized protein n=1 Tax=Prorocentrum cordatum TaxID=2364126 RepID=A0ABN9SCL9_9DINO|nr:unnamed protein product [Polarella glacialis]
MIECLSHLGQESTEQSGQCFETSLGSELAETSAQLGPELAIADSRGEDEQLMEIETLLMRAQRRAAAIVHDICKDADPAEHERPMQARSKMAREWHRHV